MITCYITDSQRAGGLEALIEAIARNLDEGVDLVQIREKEMDTRPLMRLVIRVLELPNPHNARILVNSRIDVALACGADGVHLPSDSIPASRVRKIAPMGFLIGTSAHSVAETTRAQEDGADFVLFSPVFLTPSKPGVQPAGLDGLRLAAGAVTIPVLALGGVTRLNAPQCMEAGAAGIAGISLFQGEGRI